MRISLKISTKFTVYETLSWYKEPIFFFYHDTPQAFLVPDFTNVLVAKWA